MYHVGAKNATEFNTGAPILLQHGLLDSSDTWIINDEQNCPGFILAN
jgi:gastric triacylglycerol lipase